MAEGQLHRENRNLICAESQKLATVWNPNHGLSVLVICARLNQGDEGFPLGIFPIQVVGGVA